MYEATVSPVVREPETVNVSLEYTDPEVTEYPFKDGSEAPYILETSLDLIEIERLARVIVAGSVAEAYVPSPALVAVTTHEPDAAVAVNTPADSEQPVPLVSV